MAYSRGRGRLQYWLDVREMKQTELARRTGWHVDYPDNGWSPRMISHFCSNKKPMSVEAIYTFGQILGLSDPLVQLYESWVWDGTGEDPKRR